jgi:competence protein ComGC
MEFLIDLWLFMKERKKFWLAPIIIVLLLIGLLIIFGGSSAVAPFIYTIF